MKVKADGSAGICKPIAFLRGWILVKSLKHLSMNRCKISEMSEDILIKFLDEIT